MNYQNGVAEYECNDGYWYEPGVFTRSRECTDSVWEDWQNVTDCYGRYLHCVVLMHCTWVSDLFEKSFVFVASFMTVLDTLFTILFSGRMSR